MYLVVFAQLFFFCYRASVEFININHCLQEYDRSNNISNKETTGLNLNHGPFRPWPFINWEQILIKLLSWNMWNKSKEMYIPDWNVYQMLRGILYTSPLNPLHYGSRPVLAASLSHTFAENLVVPLHNLDMWKIRMYNARIVNMCGKCYSTICEWRGFQVNSMPNHTFFFSPFTTDYICCLEWNVYSEP